MFLIGEKGCGVWFCNYAKIILCERLGTRSKNVDNVGDVDDNVISHTAPQLLSGVPTQSGRSDTGKLSGCQLRHKSVAMPSSGDLLCLPRWVDGATDQLVAMFSPSFGLFIDGRTNI